jgi:glutaredoxin
MTKLASGKSSVPQIFFDDLHVGGFDNLKEIFDKGCLIKMLKDEKI